MNLVDFATLIRAHDGVDAFNEASRLAFAGERPGRVELVVTDGPQITAAAFAPETGPVPAPVELAVHPDRRRHGHGTDLLDRLIAAGETRFWAHGDLTGAQGLAVQADLVADRTLLVLRRDNRSVPDDTSKPEWTIRPFQTADVAAIVDVNRRAFADHPEQGAMDSAEFTARSAADWFDPQGLLVVEVGGEIAGFHWTKVEHGVGEVYVAAVDPKHQGIGLGRALLIHGLRHLAHRGVSAVDLYVERDNQSARELYSGLGFAERSRDVLYVSKTPAATAPAPS